MKHPNILFGLIIFCFLSVAGVVVLTAFEQNPLSYPSRPFKMDEMVYEPGDTITFELERCSTKEDAAYNFSANLRNLDTGYEHALPGGNSVAPKGCQVLRSIPKTLPTDVPVGKYCLEFVVHVNGMIKTFVMKDLHTEPFLIR